MGLNISKTTGAGSKVTMIVRISDLLYPKKKSDFKDGGFAIIKVIPMKTIEGDIAAEAISKSGLITLKGNVPSIDTKADFKVIGECVDSSYGLQYNIVSMNINMDFTKESGREKFLEYVLPEKTLNKLKEKLGVDGAFEAIANEDIETLMGVKGVGFSLASSLIKKYKANLDNGEVYIALAPYGLSKAMCDMLCRRFKNSHTFLINKVKENPYWLIEHVKGIGWKKADDMALFSGFRKDCEERISAYVRYYLIESAESSGNTWTYSDDLIKSLRKDLFEDEDEKSYKGEYDSKIKQCLVNMIKDGRILSVPESKNKYRITLPQFYELEQKIAQKLLEIRDSKVPYLDPQLIEKTIKECEEENGWKYTDEQKEIIHNVLSVNNLTVVTGKAGCVDRDTEFWSLERGWTPIGDYDPAIDSKILQYNLDGTAVFSAPLSYIKEKMGEGEQMIHYKQRIRMRGVVDIMATPDHSIPLRYYPANDEKEWRDDDLWDKVWGEEKYRSFRWGDIINFRGMDTRIRKEYGFIDKFKVWRNEREIPSLSESELRLAIEIYIHGMAFGSHRYRFKDPAVFDRIGELGLKSNLIQKFFYETKEKLPESRYMTLSHPKWARDFDDLEKTITSCSEDQIKIMCDEVIKYDLIERVDMGYRGGKILEREFGVKGKYSRGRKKVELLWFLFTAIGYSVHIKPDSYKGALALIVELDGNYRSLAGNRQEGERDRHSIYYKIMDPNAITVMDGSPDGYKYCFEMGGSHMWFAKRGNFHFVSGNSGKSSVMLPIVRVFQKMNMDVAQVALSGRAALNLTEITGVEGQTIHRLLGLNGSEDSEKEIDDCLQTGEDWKLPCDVVIVDELSMVGGEIFLKLLEKLKEGCKLICIGDPGQLEAIGLCNLLYDMEKAGTDVIPSMYHMSKIMRQAEDSAIIGESARIYDGEPIINWGFYGETTRGKKNDLKIIAGVDTADCARIALDEYLRLWREDCGCDKSVEDLILLTSKRDTGEASAFVLNQKIHQIVNPPHPFDEKEWEENDRAWTGKGDNLFLETGSRGEKGYPHITIKYNDRGEVEYRVGDKIRVTKNCYHCRSIDTGEEAPVFNGNLGIIESIDMNEGNLLIRINGERVVFDEEMIRNLCLGYAITTHSAQGSGFPFVVAINDPSAFTLNCKEMLYTQITRAKKKCVLVGRSDIIISSCKKTSVKKKRTFLGEFLTYYNKRVEEP